MAVRHQGKAQISTKVTQKLSPNSQGRLQLSHLDLADLTTIKFAIEAFKSKETRLGVLVNNAEVVRQPLGSSLRAAAWNQCT